MFLSSACWQEFMYVGEILDLKNCRKVDTVIVVICQCRGWILNRGYSDWGVSIAHAGAVKVSHVKIMGEFSPTIYVVLKFLFNSMGEFSPTKYVNFHPLCTWCQSSSLTVWVNFHPLSTWCQSSSLTVWVNFHPRSTWCQSSSLTVWVNFHPLSTWCQSSSLTVWVNFHPRRLGRKRYGGTRRKLRCDPSVRK